MAQFPIFTERQKETLRVIRRMTKAKGGTGPNYYELAAEMGISYQAAMQMAERLIARGKLHWVPPSTATLKVVEEETSSA